MHVCGLGARFSRKRGWLQEGCLKYANFGLQSRLCSLDTTDVLIAGKYEGAPFI